MNKLSVARLVVSKVCSFEIILLGGSDIMVNFFSSSELLESDEKVRILLNTEENSSAGCPFYASTFSSEFEAEL